jgi:hypothetical protein
VRKYEPREIIETYEMRIALELYAVRLVIERASDDDLEALGVLLEESSAAADAAGNVPTATGPYVAELDFHQRMVSLADNSAIASASLEVNHRLYLALTNAARPAANTRAVNTARCSPPSAAATKMPPSPCSNTTSRCPCKTPWPSSASKRSTTVRGHGVCTTATAVMRSHQKQEYKNVHF